MRGKKRNIFVTCISSLSDKVMDNLLLKSSLIIQLKSKCLGDIFYLLPAYLTENLKKLSLSKIYMNYTKPS